MLFENLNVTTIFDDTLALILVARYEIRPIGYLQAKDGKNYPTYLESPQFDSAVENFERLKNSSLRAVEKYDAYAYITKDEVNYEIV